MATHQFTEWRRGFSLSRAKVIGWIVALGHPCFIALDWIARADIAAQLLPTRIVMQVAFIVALALAYLRKPRLSSAATSGALVVGVGWICALTDGPQDVYVGGLYLAIIGVPTIVPAYVATHVATQVAGGVVFVVGNLMLHPELPPGNTLQVAFLLTWVAGIADAGVLLFERQKRAELAAKAELEHAYERLSELDQAKMDFFANVSHELRTPLTLILGALRSLTKTAPSAAQARSVTTGMQNAGRLLQLINQLLDLARIDSGQMTLHRTPTNVTALVRQVTAAFDHSATDRHIEIGTQSDDLWASVDVKLLRKLLYNLVSNAVKFTPPGRGWIRIEVVAEDGGLRLSIQDNGIGIPPAKQEAVFDRFTQVDTSDTRQHEGTGIGLALVREVAELHGGTAQVTSAPNEGAHFVITLPGVILQPAATVEPARAAGDLVQQLGSPPVSLRAADRPRKGRPLVLVADDNPDLRAFVGDLIYQDYDVVTAADGRDALAIVKRVAPALVVTDLMMPQMSGQELLEAIRSLPPPANATPVVLLTAKAQEQARLDALGAGADDYLHKPFTDDELMARVRNQLTRQQQALELDARNSQLSQQLEAQVAELLRVGRLGEFVPETLRRALADGEISAEGIQRELLTCMFIDLVGYTALSSELEPKDLAELLNAYLREVSAEAALHRGRVDKFIGDAVMVLFRSGDHAGVEGQVRAAAAVAAGSHRRIGALGSRWDCELRVRVGFETGPATMAVFGSDLLRSYTAVGPTINLAARLQSACPPGHTYAGPGAHGTGALESVEVVDELSLKNIRGNVMAHRLTS